jgi:hypothetical protein
VPVLGAFKTGTVAGGDCVRPFIEHGVEWFSTLRIARTGQRECEDVIARFRDAAGRDNAPDKSTCEVREHFVEASVYDRLHRSNGGLDAALPG